MDTTGLVILPKSMYPETLFPVRRYHPFFTNTDEPVDRADITRAIRRELGLILCTAIAHILPLTVGVLTGGRDAGSWEPPETPRRVIPTRGGVPVSPVRRSGCYGVQFTSSNRRAGCRPIRCYCTCCSRACRLNH